MNYNKNVGRLMVDSVNYVYSKDRVTDNIDCTLRCNEIQVKYACSQDEARGEGPRAKAFHVYRDLFRITGALYIYNIINYDNDELVSRILKLDARLVNPGSIYAIGVASKRE